MSYLNTTHSPRAVAASTPTPAPLNLAPGDAAAGREFTYRGYVMGCGDELDGDGFTTPAYLAKPEAGGPSEWLDHPRFNFKPTREWFEQQVDRLLGGAA